MRNMEKEELEIVDVGEVTSSSRCEDMASTTVTVKEEMYSDKSSDVKPDNTFETVLVNSNQSVPCPKLEKVPESVNDMGTPFLFVGVKMEMPGDYESEVSCANLETQYSFEEYSMNDEGDNKGVDECSEGSSAMIMNNTSYVQVKKECKEDIEICEFDLQTNDDMSVSTDTNCTFDSTSEGKGYEKGHSSEKFINGMEYLEYPILRVKEEGEHPEKQIAENRKNSDSGQNLGELNSEEEKDLNKTEAEALKSRECATERLVHSDISKPFSCSTCNKCFRDRYDLKRHISTHSTVKSYSCNICNACFTCMSYLQKHMRTHTGEKRKTCDICQKSFAVKDVKEHMRTHTDEKNSCGMCQKSFSKQSNLIIHTRTHTDEKNSCDICQKSFAKKSRLIIHRRTHTGEKPYSCDICQKSFSHSQNLKIHMGTHTNEKPYSCDVCHKSFSQKKHLPRHYRIHTGEKPYSCNVCSASFSAKEYLKSHVRIHSSIKPFSCEVCKKSFIYKHQWIIHMRIHTGEKPFTCHICGKSFRYDSVLKQHMRCH